MATVFLFFEENSNKLLSHANSHHLSGPEGGWMVKWFPRSPPSASQVHLGHLCFSFSLKWVLQLFPSCFTDIARITLSAGLNACRHPQAHRPHTPLVVQASSTSRIMNARNPGVRTGSLFQIFSSSTENENSIILCLRGEKGSTSNFINQLLKSIIYHML